LKEGRCRSFWSRMKLPAHPAREARGAKSDSGFSELFFSAFFF
jgi:hypothetical protein